MAMMIDRPSGYKGEQKVWHAFEENLPNDFIIYNNRPIQGQEFDFCVFDPYNGFAIVEVKGWAPGTVSVTNGSQIHIEGLSDVARNPLEQANRYRYALINRIKTMGITPPKVMSVIAFPFLTRQDYMNAGLDKIVEEEFVLFKEDLESALNLQKKLAFVFAVKAFEPELDPSRIRMLRSIFEDEFEDSTIQKPVASNPYSLLCVFTEDASDQILHSLFSSYEQGTKLLLFVSSQRMFDQILHELSDCLWSRNVRPAGNSLEICSERWIPQSSPQKEFKTFNLELYRLDRQDQDLLKNLMIENGKVQQEEKDCLKYLAEHTTFNSTQYQIEHAPADKNILIKAGAGTGKTYSMISRVSFLTFGNTPYIQDIADELYMITFTNKAADNMKERLEQLYLNYFRLTKNPHYLGQVRKVINAHISTIHKFSLTLIQHMSAETGLGASFAIGSDEKTRQNLYREKLNAFFQSAVEEDGFDLAYLGIPYYELQKLLLEMGNQFLQKNIDPSLLSEDMLGEEINNTIPNVNKMLARVVKEAETEYLQRIKSSNKLPLNELILELNRLLHITKRNLIPDCRYLFVDEFQDTDDIQIDLLADLYEKAQKQFRFFIVGDLKQSIYRFRGATLSAFDRMQSQVGNWIQFSLQTNYRTDLRLLNRFHEQFTAMGEAKLLPYETQTDRLYGVKQLDTQVPLYIDEVFESEDDRAEAFVQASKEAYEEAKNYCLAHDTHATIAVLVRMNSEADWCIQHLQEADLPVDLSEQSGLFQSEAAIDLMKLLLALTNPYDPVILANLLQSNYFAMQLDPYLLSGLEQETKYSFLLNTLDAELLKRGKQPWHQIVEQAFEGPTLSLLRNLYKALKPWAHYSEHYSAQLNYCTAFDQLIENLVQYRQIQSQTITDVCEYLKVAILTAQEVTLRKAVSDDQQDLVRFVCMTVHKSKGLEFDTVILPSTDRNLSWADSKGMQVERTASGFGYYVNDQVGSQEVILKNSNFQLDHNALEEKAEEIRILYVAMTRAVRRLIWLHKEKNEYISWASYLEDTNND